MIAEKVKKYRKNHNISSKKLSALLGRAPAYISQIENGRNKKPDTETIGKIFDILKFTDEDKNLVIKEVDQYDYVDRNQSSKTFNHILTKDNLEDKFYEDANELANIIKSLPTETRKYLKELLSEEF